MYKKIYFFEVLTFLKTYPLRQFQEILLKHHL